MKLTFVSLLLLFISISCTQNTSNDKKLSKDVITAVIYDLTIADGTISAYSDFVNRTYVKQDFYDRIFKVHGIDADKFRWNILYYTETREINAMYENVINRLNENRTALEKAKMDSLMPKPNPAPQK